MTPDRLDIVVAGSARILVRTPDVRQLVTGSTP